ncbi:hypothetical protein FisN_14Lh008 [Fistulifera solaris]|uniref:Purple acid phosphatase n=1 Tax=Fistulifera solaris TaxID=1519565 RepID=A0A1Z5KHA0_FISSO|nr:hypothetical protein FisN_14Lh008 [Fistulifera solaris]|eukprot:GAX25700.1 hypothetical protein FisN_14Lh008 [Fistulifera solaris]
MKGLQITKRASYEPILDENDQRRHFYHQCFACLTIVSLVMIGFFVPHPSLLNIQNTSNAASTNETSSHHEVLPTLLRLINPETKTPLYALDNPTYEQFKSFQLLPVVHNDFHIDEKNENDWSILQVTPLQIAPGESITLAWDSSRVLPDDWLVLQCTSHQQQQLQDHHHSSSKDDNNMQILEVATMDQVVATAQSPSSWTIPAFPVSRFDSCQFILYRSVHEHHSTASTTLQPYSVTTFFLHASQRPTAIHWAMTNRTDSWVVHFVTGASGTPVLQYNGNQKVTGKSTTYTAADLCSEPANQTEPGKFQSPGILHQVYVEHLIPGTTMQYQVGVTTGQGIEWSPNFSWTVPDFAQFNYTYLVFGDQGAATPGSEWTAAAVTREVAQQQVMAVHHVGDLSYANGAAHLWDAWFDMIQPYTTQVPLMIAVGNHEYDYWTSRVPGLDPSGAVSGYHPTWGTMENDSGGECGVPTAKHFTMPDMHNHSNGVFWYAFDMGIVHTIVLSSEHDLRPGSPQYDFLMHALSTVDRTEHPWLIIEIHRPLYHAEAKWDQNAVGVALRFEVEDLFYDYRVDAVLSGHYHSYFRTCDGLYASRCGHDGAPMHITIGSSGAKLDTIDLYDAPWTATYLKGVFGYGRLTVANTSALFFEYVQTVNETYTQVLDEVWIVRDR